MGLPRVDAVYRRTGRSGWRNKECPGECAEANDLVLVRRPGASISPWSGLGNRSVDESMVTGRSKPVDKGIDSKIIAGAINGDGGLRVRVAATVIKPLWRAYYALGGTSTEVEIKTQLLTDQTAGWLFYIALAVLQH